jgi:RNA polymerase sigma-70 factor (ECF subfamily)
MNRLSPRLRAAVLLALVEEEPYEEIARALGISVNAVKVRVFRGVRILRKELEKTGVHA